MGNRRRNLFVLLFVVGMLIASTVVILSRPTRLGLDLSGGTELVYEGQPTPQNPEVTPEDIDRAIEIIRERTDKLGVSEPEISRVGRTSVSVGLPDVKNQQRAIDRVGTTAQLQFYDWEPNLLGAAANVDDEKTTAALLKRWQKAGYDTTRSSVRQLISDGAEPTLFDAVKVASKEKGDPDCKTCTAGDRYYAFTSSGKPLNQGQPEPRRSDLFLDQPREREPPGSQVVKVPKGVVVVENAREPDEKTKKRPPRSWFVLRDRPELNGTDIKDPQQEQDPTTNQPNVTMDFTGDGREKFQKVTRRIAQRGLAEGQPNYFAIVLDDEIVSRPFIDFEENPDGIDGRTGAQISGGFTLPEAQDLAEFLRIGALPIKLKLISTSTVSATLGQQALDQGLKAGIAGLIIVLLFLILYYRFLGFVAGIGLLVYAAFFYAMIELIPITLTLPGIAGLILTIGVAADSNIVIFERIKEEAREGKSMPSAIAAGYSKGIRTIIDANVITLITAFILFVLATSGVKGFAFTLGIGTVVSLFTAVVFTQAILGSFSRARFLRSPRFLGAGEQRVRWRFDFTGLSRWFFSMSGLILTVGAISLAVLGLNFGLDFESGTRINASLREAASEERIRSTLRPLALNDAEIQDIDNPDFGQNVIQLQTQDIAQDDVGKVQQALDRDFGLVGGEDGFNSTSIGPTFGQQVARSALYAIVFSLLVICGYVALRFQPKFAVPVIIAVFHDILITAGVYSLSEREVTSGTVAAFLTILGYSLYDTVIVFDRIRENMPRMPRAAFSQVVNRSMSEVLTRSLITGLSTVFLIGVLLVFGGETLKDFAFAMLVGVASGTYSSIFIASPVLTAWKEREPQYRARRRHIERAMGQVPPFADQNVVAKLEEAEELEGEEVPGEPEEAPSEPEGEEVPAAVADEPADERRRRVRERAKARRKSAPRGGAEAVQAEPEGAGDGKPPAEKEQPQPAGTASGESRTSGRPSDSLAEDSGGSDSLAATGAGQQGRKGRRGRQRKRRKHGRNR